MASLADRAASGQAPPVGIVGTGKLGTAILMACQQLELPIVLTASARHGWRVDSVPAVLVDASAPTATEQVRDFCHRHGTALVECVSNLTAGQWEALTELARFVPVVRATNLALGHYLQDRVVEYVARLGAYLTTPVEVSVWERHPAAKAHRPSASAAALAQTWTAASGSNVCEISSRRAGLPVSEHEVLWAWAAETLLVRHHTVSQTAAAMGAVAAVRWAAGRTTPGGPVSMHSVFDDLIDSHRRGMC